MNCPTEARPLSAPRRFGRRARNPLVAKRLHTLARCVGIFEGLPTRCPTRAGAVSDLQSIGDLKALGPVCYRQPKPLPISPGARATKPAATAAVSVLVILAARVVSTGEIPCPARWVRSLPNVTRRSVERELRGASGSRARPRKYARFTRQTLASACKASTSQSVDPYNCRRGRLRGGPCLG
jgi:hypothetical protein